MSSEKQEQATEQRKRKAKESGDVPASRELTAAAAMVAGLLVLRPASSLFLNAWRSGLERTLGAAMQPFPAPEQMLRAYTFPLAPALLPVGLVLCTSLVAAVCLGAAQAGGLSPHGNMLLPRAERISIAAHAKQVLGMRAWLRLAKSIVPACAVVWIAVHALQRQIIAAPVLTTLRLPSAVGITYEVALTAGWIALGSAGLDYAMERRNWSRKLRMSKQDIRDEAKESNGNPHTKGRIRQVQRAMRRRRVKADVSQATVVITNPTHYAVALAFDMQTMAAPRVLSKGRDLHAFAIREEARWAGVPIVENPPLARSLYRSVDEGQAIPFELYTAVAAILAFLLRRDTQTGSNNLSGTTGTRMNS